MSQILNKVRDLDPHDTDAAKEALSSFFPNLAKHKEGDCVRWLRSLEGVINRFPKLCGSQRANIEKYIVHFLDSSNCNIVIEAAKCAHVLQQVRPGQEKAATPKVCWRDLMSALCNAVHSLLSEIFPNAVNIYRSNGEEENKITSDSILLSTLSDLSLVSGQERILNRQQILCTRLRNVFIFIQAMLVEIYPVGKPVRPQMILDAVIRALGASGDAAHSSESVATVKTHALRTLDALVACLGSNLIPFSPLVFKCVMQTLRWTSDNQNDQTSGVRITAYNSLSTWLNSLRCHRAPVRARGWHDELVSHITSDVTPQTHTVQLTMNNPPRNLSKKQKKKQAQVMLQQSSIANYAPGANNTTTCAESNEETVIAALECTETFLTVCGIFLKPATHKVFHELLVRECFHLADYSSARGLALLRALEASRRSAPPGVPPPTQYCLQLYSAAVNSQCREISKFCTQALLDIRLHLHCSPPSLSFAADTQTAQKEVEEKRRMSRRNREALESLLGADKIPPESCDIDAPELEEPTIKKPRIDDDKISLSSSSEHSIQVCDSDSEDIEEVPMDPEETHAVHEISTEETIVTHADVHEISTEDNPDTTDYKKVNNIHEATTQMPIDTVDGDSLSGKSNEVGYGYPNTGKSVAVLENLEDENLPNTNETDDVHITCGQVAVTPEDLDKEDINIDKEIKVNGVKSPEKSPEKREVEGSVTVKMAVSNDGVSVEDMLADFVDEVNDDNITQA
ncbi:proline-, glutamic acid- and leucine-rich protein 1-like [Leguminivora glycinivorella]|uniref:proline-, glutamic acid- and leucine-rich protein 1-like n=1 Tax=Leguminivora glycinivorella TaxID=1035111 RepID=UPI00200BF7BD|nr:proline-, glutamic acid- and leucine-rich protein 1-like [Leguminivora glycinivorella]